MLGVTGIILAGTLTAVEGTSNKSYSHNLPVLTGDKSAGPRLCVNLQIIKTRNDEIFCALNKDGHGAGRLLEKTT